MGYEGADIPCMDIPTTAGDEPLIDIATLAAWLCVSDHAVRKWVQSGPASGRTPPALRINGQIRFRPSDVRAWIDTKAIA